ncbi:MAG: hypothetical protein J0I50_04935, partial [Microbacterium sp.]|nr:hypothetical protein [Microbacterium sp.]
ITKSAMSSAPIAMTIHRVDRIAVAVLELTNPPVRRCTDDRVESAVMRPYEPIVSSVFRP